MSQQHAKSSQTSGKAIPAFFSPGNKKDAKNHKTRNGQKMAAAGKELSEEADMPSRADIHKIAGRLESLEKGLLTKIDILQTLTEKIDHLTSKSCEHGGRGNGLEHGSSGRYQELAKNMGE